MLYHRKMKIIFAVFAFSTLMLAGCKKEKIQPGTENPATTNPVSTAYPLSGHYKWVFDIPGVGQQESHLVFYKDSIGYVMIGDAYSTNYKMIQESYKETETEKRWIGVGKGGSINKDGKYFVLFFKNISASTVEIYKHECENKEEAYSFPLPDDQATADHGWNVYNKL